MNYDAGFSISITFAAVRKKNVVLENVPVTAYAAEGKALARHDGKVIFIEGGVVPGDVVDVRLGKNKKDWAEGKVVHFHSYSDKRVTPFCQHFGTCGGCKWQMLPYALQLEYKQQQVADHLQRIGKLALPPMEPILGSAHTEHYRNKLEFTFSNKAYLTNEEIRANDGEIPVRPALGFHVPKLFDKVLNIDTCYLMQEPVNLIRNTIREYAVSHDLTFYDIRAQQGWLRNLVIRLCTTGEIMVNLVIHHEDKPNRIALLDHLLKTVPAITTVLYTINPKGNDTIFDLEPKIYFGKGYAEEKLEDFVFKIGPKSFFQTNTYQGEVLYKVTRDFAGLTGSEIVYDLYCGTGSIGIFVSRNARKVVGIELIKEAIDDAKENAARNNVDNATFFAGDVVDICNNEFFAQHGQPDVIITDPPRAGMHEKLVNKLLEIGAPRIVYVSCNPATQARDLALLDSLYTVEKVQPVDMFPHTHHIENVVLLKKRDNN
ncbi:23S rRNA (uracil1939-C5)-methyltransferase [Chitinophaga ginsengisegetis]|uniref:23S rRNA (Uracil1939-C5)-methyltransferase n=1 Tax=Chitinophaga ginsengisegetis TaxID=393003 RepID=A0A1T5P688_9BACT|nr:23S rRNA (uracil(1939)-C(5))-methyltransferase RlmD [Chitinophaga ginsengisegetis]MDR6566316.1 23S rRNA (uracil1939-C5)-methyltransferase [Chitinophaga ginsengisegetis]MDR6646046.1 23S rRNA (uracil1939-C5)-methyltransferase [Chitinophaga ginsengisegetis]MDR6651362.1 23S rRNA (uracil1939-C5)-methyltransferase [Chitinophaga ginsengisegetis]SKD08147.1 23S rRNA (uracil1939-C5)-methyltransferase [Chitinophaga ginsengisegetis]